MEEDVAPLPPPSASGGPAGRSGQEPSEGSSRTTTASPGLDRGRLVAGVILLFLSGLGLFQGFVQTFGDVDPSQNPVRLSNLPQSVSGTVRDENGTPLVGVAVTSVLDPELGAETDADGSYRLDGLPAGYAEVRFSQSGRGNLTLRLVVLAAQRADVELPDAGDRTEDHASLTRQIGIQRGLGGLVIALSGLTIGGAVACYRARHRWLGLLGSLTGLMVGLPISIFLAPPAAFLVWRARWHRA